MRTLSFRKDFLKFFPVPDFLLLATSGISISEDGLKFADLRRGGQHGELELSNYCEIPLPDEALGEGLVQDKAVLIEALKKLKEKTGVTYARVSLPEEKSYLFTTHVEEVAGGDLSDAVAFVLEENAPVSLAESIFAYEVVERAKGKSEVKVAVSVLPKSVASAYIEALEGAGIVPVAFDLESQAVARAVVPHEDKGTVFVLNLGEKRTGLYIVESGHVQFSLTTGHVIGGDTSDLGSLQSEVRKLFSFWNTRIDRQDMPEKKIERIIVSGSKAGDKDLVDKLLSGVDVQYSLADVWHNVFLAMHGGRVPSMPFDKSLGFASAIGLALASR